MVDETKKDEIKEEGRKVKEETKKEKITEKAQSERVKGDEKPLDKMTVPELKEIAKTIPDVTGVTAMKKDELLKIVKEFRGIEDEAPLKVKKKKVRGKEISVKDLKEKVVQLKRQKEAAQETKDRKKINVLRRRINRLKKHTRKIARA